MVIDAIIECCAINQISGGALNMALLQLMASSMRASGELEHGLNDEDGVCIIHVRLYE
jgi:hypothetical protein